MQSYKIKKITETSMFPIEYELKLMREENSSNWFTLMWQLISIVFSGIAVTLLCQREYIPSLFNYIAQKYALSTGMKYLLEIILIISLFLCLVTMAFVFIQMKIKTKDNKRLEIDREKLAEYFHKIIFNNITTGRSLLKKGMGLPNDEKELYFCEAIYYFKLAHYDIIRNKIFEVGFRSKYISFLKIIGINTLLNTLRVYKESIEQLEKLLPDPEKITAEEIHKDLSHWEISIRTLVNTSKI